MSRSSPQSRRWCFTLNNPSSEEVAHIVESCSDPLKVVYAVFGRETGESGTPHLQGFVIFKRANRRRACLSLLSQRCHLEVTIGTSRQASDYCKKDGDFDEYGEFPGSPGGRSDLQELIAWGESFEANNGRPPTSPEVARAQPIAYLRYPRVVRLFETRAAAPTIRDGQPNEWQAELERELCEPADDRKVIFYVDPDGGKGKTWFQQYFLTKHPFSTQVLSIGKRDDLAHVIDVSKSVFFFNVPRGGMEFFQYTVAESIKDRMVFSPKYASKMKYMQNESHVVVFCNEDPDITKMSEDRFDIRTF